MAPHTSWIEVLESWARARPDALAFRFLVDGDEQEERVTFAELARNARALAADLQAEGAGGERVLLLYPSGLEFITAFMGCLYAGAVAVPAYPPDPARLDRTLPRLEAIVADARPRLVLTTRLIRELAGPLVERRPALEALRWRATDDPGDGRQAWRAPSIGADDIALLQYTSGSTGEPRGVIVSHGNLIHNSRAIQRSFGHDDRLVGVGWLPLYHDMGLIGKVLQPLYMGRPCTLLSPVDFLRRPARWLEAISRYGATTSGGPNFAYDLCVRKVTAKEREALDLRSWQVAFVGAEPVRPETLDRFAAAFGASGFQRRAFLPCYGLAEATLMVTGGSSGLAEERRDDKDGRADAGTPDDGAPIGTPGLGAPALDQDVAIVDPVTKTRRPSGEVGEIWVSGPSVAKGYWNRPAETAATFSARLTDAGERPFLRTGDLGFLRGGELYVTGRMKDVIIVRGKNHYPQDIEHTAEASSPELRPGCTAAFAIEVDREERVVVLAEVRRSPGAAVLDPSQVVADLCRAVASEHDLQPYAVWLLAPGTIPKTSSGKIRRFEARAAFLAGDLETVSKWSLSPPSIDAEPGVYSEWSAGLEKLERRSTRYRFDLERDICWDELAVRGDYVGPTWLASYGIDHETLGTDRDAHDLFQWAMALSICETFISVEEGILRFLASGRGVHFASKSLVAFREEEEKHVRLFRRYADHLRTLRPELCARFDAVAADMVQFHRRVMDNSLNLSESGRHYQAWLYAILLEEGSIYLHEQLLADGAGLQPTWISVHAAHRREEIQHVATDAAYVEALSLTEDERYRLSRLWVRVAVKYFGRLGGLEPAYLLLAEHHPDQAKAVQSSLRMPKSYLHELIYGQAFAKTRRAARYLGRLAEAGEVAQREELALFVEQPASDAMDEGTDEGTDGGEVEDTRSAAPAVAVPATAAAWRETLAQVPKEAGRALLVRHLSARIAEAAGERLVAHHDRPGDVHLLALGIDSLAAVDLAARLEADLGIAVPAFTAYDNTLSELASQLVEKIAPDVEYGSSKARVGPEGEAASVGEAPDVGSARASGSLLIQLRPVMAPQPFFCVGGVAGMVKNLSSLAHLVGQERGVFALHTPGLDGKESPPRHMDPIAKRLLTDVRAVQPQGPYLLGGYSFGGIVAYEMAQQLVSNGEEVSQVVLIDAGLPEPRQTEVLVDRELAVHELLIMLQHYSSKDPQGRARADLAAMSWVEQRAMVQRILHTFEIDLTPEQTEAVIGMYGANLEASYRYRPAPARFPVTLFRATDRPARVAEYSLLALGSVSAPGLGWERVCGAALDIKVAPGSHITMVRHPHVSTLARMLNGILDFASAGSTPLFAAARLSGSFPYASRASM